MTVWDHEDLEATRADFRRALGLAGYGLAGLRQLSDAQKRQIDVEVSQLEEGGMSHAAIALRAEQLREQIRGAEGWSSSWAPRAFGGWRSSSDLLEAVNAAHRLSLATQTDRISPSAIDIRTGAARVDSPYAAGASEFAVQVQERAAELGRESVPVAIKVGLALGALYLAGQWLQGRGRR